MPIKSNISVNRKISDKDYCSRGASVSLEVELDSSLIQAPDQLQARIRQVFCLAQEAVDEELARQQQSEAASTSSYQSSRPSYRDNGHHNGNGHGSNGNGNGYHRSNGQQRTNTNGRKATASQVRAIHAIINRQGLDLVETLARFGVSFAEDLGIAQASQLIDDLKSQAEGTGGRR